MCETPRASMPWLHSNPPGTVTRPRRFGYTTTYNPWTHHLIVWAIPFRDGRVEVVDEIRCVGEGLGGVRKYDYLQTSTLTGYGGKRTPETVIKGNGRRSVC